jgi:Glycosyl transferase family group 2
MFRKRTRRERFWEILPGLSFWSVFLGAIVLSFLKPVWAAVFIVCFDLYWLLKAMNTTLHLVSSYRRYRIYIQMDWLLLTELIADREKLFSHFLSAKKISKSNIERDFYRTETDRIKAMEDNGVINRPFTDFYHLIVVPFVDESAEVLSSTITALTQVKYPLEKMILLLASEERAGEPAQEVARAMVEKFQNHFLKMIVTVHPDGMPDEIKGKSANTSYAVASILPLLEEMGINEEQVLISNLDSDTIVHQQYFARVMYAFLTSEKPYRRSYQPIAVYNNNIWDSPAFIRVVSVSNSFFQFTESSRPDRLRTFASHTMTLKALRDVGFWKKDIINEDGFIFWQCYLHYEGDYAVVPLFITVSLDTCLADTFWQTLINQYKQKKRWAYNVEYYPHLVPALLKSKAPFWDRMYKLFQYVEGDFNWATASLLITVLGWLPLFIGGPEFKETVIAYNLPHATRTLMTIATGFLIFSVYINLILLPPRPKKYSVWRSIMMYLQWVLVPATSLVFGSLPAIEAQTRLMMGWYLEFFVTPKSRKGEVTAMNMQTPTPAAIPVESSEPKGRA